MPLFRFQTSRSLALSFALLLLTHAAEAQSVNFALPNLDNQIVRLTDFRGQWVIVNFWATWCIPCLLEMPELQAFYKAQSPRVAVLGVNFEDIAASQIRPFIAKLGITFPIMLSGGQSVPSLEIKGLPTTFLISPSGQIADTHLGTVNAASLTERLAELKRMGGSR